MCLTEIGDELWICFKHPDGQFVTERKSTFDDILKIVSAAKIMEREHPPNSKENVSTCRLMAACAQMEVLDYINEVSTDKELAINSLMLLCSMISKSLQE